MKEGITLNNRNVMPTLPNQPGNTSNQHKNTQGRGKVNKKALIIFAIIVVVVIVLIVIGNVHNNSENNETSSSVETESFSYEPEPVESSIPEPPNPADNSGTEIPNLLAEGSVYDTGKGYILATSLEYEDSKAIADATTLAMDKKLTITPSSSCVYSYSFNKTNVMHTSGSVLTISRVSAINYKQMPTPEDYRASLEKHAILNGINNPVYGEVYVGTELRGSYVKGSLKLNSEDTDKTILLLFFSGSPEIYGISIIFDCQDSLELLLNGIRLDNSAIKLN